MATTADHGNTRNPYDVPTKAIIHMGHLSPRSEGDAADGAGDYSARRPVAADHRYIPNVIYATFSLVVHIIDVITSLILVASYFNKGLNSAAVSLLVIHIIRALTQIELEWTNAGRCRYFLLDLFYLRIVVEYWRYMLEWRAHIGRPWRRREFRSTCSFETFMSSMPSLIVHSYVFLISGYYATIQMVAFFAAVISAVIDLLHHFNYVTVNASTYATQMTKAVFNSIIRVSLVALLVEKLGSLVWAFILLSYVFGCVIYNRAVRMAAIDRQDDDPLHHTRCHMVYGNLIAMTMLFVSFPFGVSHSVHDWWYGYLASEMKMLLENIIMVIYVMYDEWTSATYSRESFYAAVFLIAMVMLLNFVGLALLHSRVKRYFVVVRRNLYTTSLIVHLFAHLCRHLKYKIDGKYPDDEHYKEGGGRAPEGLIKVFPTSAPSHGGAHEDMTALLAHGATNDDLKDGRNPNGGNTVIAIGSAGHDDSHDHDKPARQPSRHSTRHTSHSHNGDTNGNGSVALIGAVATNDEHPAAARPSSSSIRHTNDEPVTGSADKRTSNHSNGESPGQGERRRASSTLVSNMARGSTASNAAHLHVMPPSFASSAAAAAAAAAAAVAGGSSSPKVTTTTTTTTIAVIDEPENESSIELGTISNNNDRAAIAVAMNLIAPPLVASTSSSPLLVASPMAPSSSLDNVSVDDSIMQQLDHSSDVHALIAAAVARDHLATSSM